MTHKVAPTQNIVPIYVPNIVSSKHDNESGACMVVSNILQRRRKYARHHLWYRYVSFLGALHALSLVMPNDALLVQHARPPLMMYAIVMLTML